MPFTGVQWGGQHFCWRGGGRRPGSRKYCVGIPWVTLEENIPLAGVHLEEGILPLQGKNTLQAPLSSYSLARYRSMHRGQITCSQFFIVLYHKLQAPALPCNYSPGTEQHQTQCGEAQLQRRGVGLRHSRSFKIWSFVFHPGARHKTQENCGTGCAHGSGTDKLRAGISLGHQKGGCSIFF